MPRQRYTLAELRARLEERVGNQSTFWTQPEFRDALNEAIAFWQTLTGEWTTRASIPAKTDSANFYPVPKQIVSATRVGVFDADEAFSALGGTIVPPNLPVFLSEDRAVYHSSTGQDVIWHFLATGGVGPYSVLWNWGDGSTTQGSVKETHAFDAAYDGQTVTVTATVTDTSGETFVATFDVELHNPTIVLYDDVNVIPTGTPYSVGSEASGSYRYTDWIKLRAGIQLDGSASTSAQEANRYPYTVQWDFQSKGLESEGGNAPIDQVQFADANMVLQLTKTVPEPLTFSHTIENDWHWNDGATSPGFPYQNPDAIGGGEGPSDRYQDPDNMQYDVDGNGYGERGYVRFRMSDAWFESMGQVALMNMEVKVTDGTGYTATRQQQFQVELGVPAGGRAFVTGQPGSFTEAREFFFPSTGEHDLLVDVVKWLRGGRSYGTVWVSDFPKDYSNWYLAGGTHPEYSNIPSFSPASVSALQTAGFTVTYSSDYTTTFSPGDYDVLILVDPAGWSSALDTDQRKAMLNTFVTDPAGGGVLITGECMGFKGTVGSTYLGDSPVYLGGSGNLVYNRRRTYSCCYTPGGLTDVNSTLFRPGLTLRMEAGHYPGVLIEIPNLDWIYRAEGSGDNGTACEAPEDGTGLYRQFAWWSAHGDAGDGTQAYKL